MRYFIQLAYNGKNYFGWQIQPKQISVQQKLEEALSTLMREEIKITGAGRTDTGVHAKQSFAHFDTAIEPAVDLAYRLNQFLPNDIKIDKIFKVKNDAHARFDALSRTYQYKVHHGKTVFDFDFCWQLHQSIDIEKMNEAAKLLLGKQDFSSFAKIHTDVKTHICEVKTAKWEQTKDDFKFTITADRFLRDMVRSIVGTLVDVGREKISIRDFKEIIAKKDRKFASGSAPAQGLFLTKVEYPNSIFIDE